MTKSREKPFNRGSHPNSLKELVRKGNRKVLNGLTKQEALEKLRKYEADTIFNSQAMEKWYHQQVER